MISKRCTAQDAAELVLMQMKISIMDDGEENNYLTFDLILI